MSDRPASPPRGRAYSRSPDRYERRRDDRRDDRRADRRDDRYDDRGRDSYRRERSPPRYDRGSDRGYDRGSDRGYDRGSDRGYDRGSDRGYDRGYDRGPPRGYDRGPPRGYGRGPPPRGYGGGGYGRGGPPPEPSFEREARKDRTSLLVRKLSYDAHAEDVKEAASKFGTVIDVYLPRDYYSKRPKGIAFVQFEDERDAIDAQRGMDGMTILNMQVQVVFAEHGRKRVQGRRNFGGPPKTGGGGREFDDRPRDRSPPPRAREDPYDAYVDRSPARERSPGMGPDDGPPPMTEVPPAAPSPGA